MLVINVVIIIFCVVNFGYNFFVINKKLFFIYDDKECFFGFLFCVVEKDRNVLGLIRGSILSLVFFNIIIVIVIEMIVLILFCFSNYSVIEMIRKVFFGENMEGMWDFKDGE